MRIVLLILLPDPSDAGSCLFCYSCSSVALALLQLHSAGLHALEDVDIFVWKRGVLVVVLWVVLH